MLIRDFYLKYALPFGYFCYGLSPVGSEDAHFFVAQISVDIFLYERCNFTRRHICHTKGLSYRVNQDFLPLTNLKNVPFETLIVLATSVFVTHTK